MKTLIISLSLWTICGVIAYGWTLHEFQDGWPALAWPHRHHDRLLASVVALLGPAGLVIALVGSALPPSPHVGWGLRFRCLTKEESWEAHWSRWPNLSYDCFLRG